MNFYKEYLNMFPEIPINKATPSASMQYLFEQIHVFIRGKDWRAFFIYLGAAWEWRHEGDAEVVSLFDRYFLEELRFMANLRVISALEKYATEYLFTDPVTAAPDQDLKDSAENARDHVEQVTQYWLRHLDASYFLSEHFIFQCSGKYFFDTLLLILRQENTYIIDLIDPLHVRSEWTNMEESRIFLKSIVDRMKSLPIFPITKLLYEFPKHRDFLWALIVDHPHRFFIFEKAVCRTVDFTVRRMVFKKWTKECQKELNPWDRSLSDKMLFERVYSESFHHQDVFSILMLVKPESHQTHACEKIPRGHFFPDFWFQRRLTDPRVNATLSADYLLYTRGSAYFLTKSLCHKWVLMHIAARDNISKINWGRIKQYDSDVESTLKTKDFTEERSYFFLKCVTENHTWHYSLMGDWFCLEQKRWETAASFARLKCIIGGDLGSSLNEILTEIIQVDKLLVEIKQALDNPIPPSLVQLKKYDQVVWEYDYSFTRYIEILGCMHLNLEKLMSSDPERNSGLQRAWQHYIGLDCGVSVGNMDRQSHLDVFFKYIPPPICFKTIPEEPAGEKKERTFCHSFRKA